MVIRKAWWHMQMLGTVWQYACAGCKGANQRMVIWLKLAKAVAM